jgi:FkbM family methyltransferase
MAAHALAAAPRRLFAARAGECEILVPSERAWAFPGGDYYERNVAAWLEQIVRAHSDPVFYDVGSNIGYYALRLAALARRVYAFEPVSETFAWLQENVRRNDLAHVEALQLGIAAAPGTARINLWSSSGASSLYAQDLGLASRGSEEIRLAALDDLVQSGAALPPAVMKLDIEGAELPALHGAQELLEQHRPDLVLECQDGSCAAAGYSPAELVAELERHGYRCHWLAQDHVDMRLHPFEDPSVPVQDLVALAPGSPVPARALAAATGVTLGDKLTVVTLDDVLREPALLSAYAQRVTADDEDATLVIWSPGRADRLDALAPLVAELGLDGDDSPDMLGLSTPADVAGPLLAMAATPLAALLA